MGANKNSNLQKCGEILIDIKSKNRKNKMYIFHCTFCNIECDQLKKFSLHIGEEHLSNFEDNLEEPELKFEIELEPEEIKIPTLTVTENTNIKIVETIDNKTCVNPDPLGTVDPILHSDYLSREIKSEINENTNDTDALCDKEEMMCSPFIGDYEKETKELEFSNDYKSFDSDSQDEINDNLDQIPLKKRKLNVGKKVQQSKQKTFTNEINCHESKDADFNNDPHIWKFPHDEQPKLPVYIRKTGKINPERKVRELEYCKRRCKEKISKEQQQFLFNIYWNLESYNDRQLYVASLINVEGTQSHRVKKSLTNSRIRIHTYKYFLELPGQSILVCQKCFRYTLCVTEQFIKTTMRKKIKGILEEGDKRGKKPQLMKFNQR